MRRRHEGRDDAGDDPPADTSGAAPDTTPSGDYASASPPATHIATGPIEPMDRRHLILLVGPILVLVVMNNIGNALAVQLLPAPSDMAPNPSANPLLLIALSVPNRNLIAASHHAALWAYFVVGFLRLIAPDFFFYSLGYHYGDRAITWMERRTPSFGKLMRKLESLFGQFGHALIVIMPNNPVSLLAGAARIPKKVFWSLNIAGTIARLILMWWVGEIFQREVNLVLGFIAEHRTPLLVLTVSLVAFTALREWRAGTSEIQQLIELEEELEEINDE